MRQELLSVASWVNLVWKTPFYSSHSWQSTSTPFFPPRDASYSWKESLNAYVNLLPLYRSSPFARCSAIMFINVPSTLSFMDFSNTFPRPIHSPYIRILTVCSLLQPNGVPKCWELGGNKMKMGENFRVNWLKARDACYDLIQKKERWKKKMLLEHFFLFRPATPRASVEFIGKFLWIFSPPDAFCRNSYRRMYSLPISLSPSKQSPENQLILLLFAFMALIVAGDLMS